MSDPSDRRSDRVELSAPSTAGQRPAGLDKEPESMTTGGGYVPPVTERGRRVSRGRLRELLNELSDRDYAVLVSVADYGFLTTGQIEALHFTDHASAEASARICRRTLLRLRNGRLLEPLERRIGGLRAGSASYVWRLGPAGDRALRSADPDAPRARRKEPSLRFLAHRLAVADVAVVLNRATSAGHFELLRIDTEPASWRSFSGGYGGREILKPDVFVVTASGDFEDHWFIEIDRGTESVPTVLKQCAQYERYRANGQEQADAGLFPRVLWLVPDERRLDRLQAGIERSTELSTDLFEVHLQSELLRAINNNQKGGDYA